MCSAGDLCKQRALSAEQSGHVRTVSAATASTLGLAYRWRVRRDACLDLAISIGSRTLGSASWLLGNRKVVSALNPRALDIAGVVKLPTRG
jgi:hypothetical protein